MSGVDVDPAREQLYTVSTNGFLDEAKTQRRNAVVRYDLKTGRLADRFDAPQAMQLNDIAVAPNGTIYATDSMSGAIFFAKNPKRKRSRRSEAKARSLRQMASRSVWTEIFTSRSQPVLQRSTLQPERQRDSRSPTPL